MDLPAFEWRYVDGFRRHVGCPQAVDVPDGLPLDGLVVDATDGPVPDWQCIGCGAVSSERARDVYRACADPQCEAFSQGLPHAHRADGAA